MDDVRNLLYVGNMYCRSMSILDDTDGILRASWRRLVFICFAIGVIVVLMRRDGDMKDKVVFGRMWCLSVDDCGGRTA